MCLLFTMSNNTTEGRESVVALQEMRIEMSEKEIVLILKDLFSDYGEHVGLTTGERYQVEMWLQEKYLETQRRK